MTVEQSKPKGPSPLGRVTGTVGRFTRHGQNLLEVARFGGLETGEQPAEFAVVDRGHNHRLRHYTLGLPADAPAVVLVPPLMVSTEVFDVSPQASAVRTLAADGVQSYVVDFGAPEREPGGLERTIEDHILAVNQAVDHVREATGKPVHLAGYSQGGMFCYQTAAYRRSQDVASITVFGSPVDMHGSTPFSIPKPIATAGARIAGGALRSRAIPGWMTRTGFSALDPVGSITSRVSFLLALHDREALLPREGQRQFLMRDGWVAFPGPALEYVLDQFVVHNRMLAGGFSVAGRAVSLADITVPVFTIIGEIDGIAPAGTVRAIRQAAPRADVHEMTLRTGHFGLVVGSTAMATSWPAFAAWVRWHEGLSGKPEGIDSVPADEAVAAPRERLEHNLELAASLAEETTRRLAASAAHPLDRVRRLAGPAAQIPRLARVGGIRPGTHLSLAGLFDKEAKRAAGTVGFLYEGMVYDYAIINERVDRVVRGLIQDGVRPGERIGVLMGTRPTTLALIIALNRLGAVAVMLRPDSDTELEARLGGVRRVYTDPANAHAAPTNLPHAVFLLRGGSESADGINHLELKPAEAPPTPPWFQRNPGRADDLAFVLFSGNGDRTRTIQVTNGRWALTAYGAASSAQLSDKDTFCSVSPLHHPAGLMTALGGAVVGGSRLAMLSDFDPSTFWEEARRYGVTVVSYTWTQLLALADAPPNPAERDHRIRLFLGSGMPRGLWRRVTERFAPATIVEFWASSERGAILANLTGTKVGSVGKPLPGTASVALARFDLDEGELERGEDAYAIPCEPGDLGILLVRDRAGVSSDGLVQHVFKLGDAWHPTTSLFRRDADGDYWLEGIVDEVIRTPEGPVLPAPVAGVFEELPQVTSAVTYATPGRNGDPLVVTALSVSKEIGPAAITAAAWRLPEHARPAIVHVVPAMILSSAGRPAGTAVRRDGIDDRQPAWWYDPRRDEYRPLTKTARAKLLAASPN